MSLRNALKASLEADRADATTATATTTAPATTTTATTNPSTSVPKRKKKPKANKTIKIKKKEEKIHPIPAPKSAFVIHAAATHEKARDTAGIQGMTKNICARWGKLTKNQRTTYNKKEGSDQRRFEKSQKKNVKMSFNQLYKTFLFPHGLEILEKECEQTINTWDGGHNDSCEACGRGGDLLLCEACNLTYHPKCLSITNIGEEGWLCPECSEELYRKVGKDVRRDEKLKLKAE